MEFEEKKRKKKWNFDWFKDFKFNESKLSCKFKRIIFSKTNSTWEIFKFFNATGFNNFASKLFKKVKFKFCFFKITKWNKIKIKNFTLSRFATESDFGLGSGLRVAVPDLGNFGDETSGVEGFLVIDFLE